MDRKLAPGFFGGPLLSPAAKLAEFADRALGRNNVAGQACCSDLPIRLLKWYETCRGL